MKTKYLFATLASAMALTALVPSASAAAGDSTRFQLARSPGAVGCLPANARGHVTISDLGPAQNLHIEVFDLPPSTDFTTFVVQVPNKPFGLAWYQGDITTDKFGRGVGDFTGIFSVETFIVAPGVAPAPKIFPDNATSNPATAPVELYHLGMWFADPKQAQAAGCGNAVTPFDGDHEAGIQVLNTSNFADDHGPLLNLR